MSVSPQGHDVPQDSPDISGANSFTENETGGNLGFSYLMADEDGRAELMASNASSLEKEEWEELQSTVIETRRQGLSIVNDLRQSGLTRPLDLSTMTSIWQKIDHVPDHVERTMNPGTRTAGGDVEYTTDGAPLPVVHMDWYIDRRVMMVSRNQGQGLDTVVPAQLTRLVNENLEDLMVNGWAPTIDGRRLYGFRDHPSRNQLTGSNWHDGTTDADDVRNDFLSVIETLEDDEYDPPYRVYLSRNEWQRLRRLVADISGGDTSDTNMRERVQEEFDLEIDDIRVSPKIPAGELVAFKPTQDVVTMGVAEDIQAIEWEEPDGWRHHFKVMAAMNLELKDTAESQMGVAHMTGLA